MTKDSFNLNDLTKRHLGLIESFYLAQNLETIERNRKAIRNVRIGFLHYVGLAFLLLYIIAGIILNIMR